MLTCLLPCLTLKSDAGVDEGARPGGHLSEASPQQLHQACAARLFLVPTCRLRVIIMPFPPASKHAAVMQGGGEGHLPVMYRHRRSLHCQHCNQKTEPGARECRLS